MIINGKNIEFHFNLTASKEIAVLCPGRDLTQIDKLFAAEDSYDFIDNMILIAIAMSKNKQNPEPLTEEDMNELEFEDLTDLVTELRSQFRRDKKTTVETQPIKKKAKEEE